MGTVFQPSWPPTTTLIYNDGKCFTRVWSDTTTFIHIDGNCFTWVWSDTTTLIHIDGKCFEVNLTTTTKSVDGVWNGTVAPPPASTSIKISTVSQQRLLLGNHSPLQHRYYLTNLLHIAYRQVLPHWHWRGPLPPYAMPYIGCNLCVALTYVVNDITITAW